MRDARSLKFPSHNFRYLLASCVSQIYRFPSFIFVLLSRSFCVAANTEDRGFNIFDGFIFIFIFVVRQVIPKMKSRNLICAMHARWD